MRVNRRRFHPNTSIWSMPNYLLNPPDNELSTRPNFARLPAMMPTNGFTNSSFITSVSPGTSNSPRITGKTWIWVMVITLAAFIATLLLVVFAHIMMNRLKRRRQCQKIAWEYSPANTNLKGGLAPISESGQSDLSSSTAPTYFNDSEPASAYKTSFRSKLKVSLQKIRPLPSVNEESTPIPSIPPISYPIGPFDYPPLQTKITNETGSGCLGLAGRRVVVYGRSKGRQGSSSVALIDREARSRPDSRYQYTPYAI
ncbi:hypothetical protein VP01_1876g5 [Puccinia sorghi]|uniref:Uncharacterized protein n=1 Tax=Puccinia sorghi TaxID=27349 RepID=A0A0L6VDP3_9BASI|nr:hypothetical protein VP01_1876g5 [Puccinia sorghi]